MGRSQAREQGGFSLLSRAPGGVTGMGKAKARTSDSRRIAALSESERDKHLDLALLLAVEAIRTEDTFEARSSLFKALLARPGLTSFLHADEGDVTSVAFSPDGKT